MTDRKKVLPNIIPNIGFNLKSQEKFILDHGVIFEHYAALPSPIGLKGRGDYRRSDKLDTLSENGFLYTKTGEFTGTILGNSHNNDHSSAGGGIYDSANARLVLPKFYNKSKKEISVLPGDKIYVRDVVLNVANYQQMEYESKKDDIAQFPITCVSQLVDSLGREYKQNVHFKITKNGNIRWIIGKDNPGIDPDTGTGRPYSIRYEYIAFFYISKLMNEIRITNKGTNDKPERMPMHCMIQREYLYHNKNRGDKQDTESDRTTEEPREALDPNKNKFKVDIRNFEE